MALRSVLARVRNRTKNKMLRATWTKIIVHLVPASSRLHPPTR